MRRAGQIVARTMDKLVSSVEPGMTTADLDQIAYREITSQGAEPNFLHYQGFPASVCISVNEEVVHGIPGQRVVAAGDVISFDCGAMVEHDGAQWHADSATTVIVPDPEGTVPVEEMKRREQLLLVTQKALWAGIAAAATAKRLGEIGSAIELSVLGSAERLEFVPELVEGYTGHGIGRELHEPPTVYNYRTRSKGPRIPSGSVLCIEPMVTIGDAATEVMPDDWTVVTLTNNVSAHFEHTVAITDEGISVLTATDAGVAGLEPYEIVPVREFAN